MRWPQTAHAWGRPEAQGAPGFCVAAESKGAWLASWTFAVPGYLPEPNWVPAAKGWRTFTKNTRGNVEMMVRLDSEGVKRGYRRAVAVHSMDLLSGIFGVLKPVRCLSFPAIRISLPSVRKFR